MSQTLSDSRQCTWYISHALLGFQFSSFLKFALEFPGSPSTALSRSEIKQTDHQVIEHFTCHYCKTCSLK